jgi:YHS domain-containing protein
MRFSKFVSSSHNVLVMAIMMIMIITIAVTSSFAESHSHKMGDHGSMHKGTVSKSDMSMKHGGAYPLETCPVSGLKLGGMGDPISYNHEGREIMFCCSACISKFEADPASYIAKVDEAIKKEQAMNYPLNTCVVSGEKLGGMMGKPVEKVYDNRLVKFCCSGCVNEFEKNPAKYIKKIDQAVIDSQKDSYPLTSCLVDPSHKLGKNAVNHVHNGKLVRFCSDSCAGEFGKNPVKYMEKLEKAKMSSGKMMMDHK